LCGIPAAIEGLDLFVADLFFGIGGLMQLGSMIGALHGCVAQRLQSNGLPHLHARNHHGVVIVLAVGLDRLRQSRSNS
jgi:hypothetical protein